MRTSAYIIYLYTPEVYIYINIYKYLYIYKGGSLLLAGEDTGGVPRTPVTGRLWHPNRVLDINEMPVG